MAFDLLLRRAQRSVLYAIGKDAVSEEGAIKLLENRLGYSEAKEQERRKAKKVKNIEQMTDEERLSFYMKACSAAGMKLDVSKIDKVQMYGRKK